MNSKGDDLLQRVAEGGDDRTAHALLAEFFEGYPVERLRLLLESDDERTLKAGAWIASELGALSNPILEDITELLSHGSRYVRFFLIDAVLSASTERDGRAIATAVELIGNTDDAIRWKAMNFLARATTSQLSAAEPFLTNHHARLTSWLIEADHVARSDEILSRLESTDSLTRLVAAAAAARARVRDVSPLEHAAQSGDPEVRSFAMEHLSNA